MKNLMVKRFQIYKELGDKTLFQLNDEQILWQSNPECNSVATIIQHLSGNMISRWTNFLLEDGEKNWRNRDKEFENKIITKTEVLHSWEKGWMVLFEAFDQIKEENLNDIIFIRGEKHTILDALLRQLAHYSYHIGQMVYIAKILKNEKWQTLSIARNTSDLYNKEQVEKNSRKSDQQNSSPVCFAESEEVRKNYLP